MFKRLAVVLLVLGCSGGFAPAAAQTQKSDVERRLDALEARVAALERVEHRRDTAPTPATPASAASMHPAVPPPPPTLPPRPAPPAQASVVADWGALHRGMSPRQVIATLGPPATRQVRPMSETWFYPGDRSVQFDRNGNLDGWTGK